MSITAFDLGLTSPGTRGTYLHQDWAQRISEIAFPPGLQESLSKTAEKIIAAALPANLAGIKNISFNRIEQLADEGITLYMVPRGAIAKKLLNADSPQAGRNILGRHMPIILDDCEAVLNRSVSTKTMKETAFTRKAVNAARSGHTEAAQALAANTIDTLLIQTFGWKTSRSITKQTPARREDLRKESVRYFMTMAPIWSAYQEFWGNDPTPTTFSRHATAHAVGPRQFSQRSTIQAIMLATAFIAWRNKL